MKSQNTPSRFLLFIRIASLSLALALGLTSCQDLLDSLNQSQAEEITITKSGISENKYVSGTLQNYPATITLLAKSGSCTAEINKGSFYSYNGSFVYNKNEKSAYLYFPTLTPSYYKTSVDLSGTNGSSSTAPVAAQITSSTKEVFQNAVTTVASLPEESTNSGENTNPGDNTEPGSTTDPITPTEPEKEPEIPTGDAPGGKYWSDYVDGIRQIDFTKIERDTDFDTVFVPKLMPLPRPDYSAIDNKVKNLVIDSSKKDWVAMNTKDKKEEVEKDIADAAKLIVQTAGATTIKEKARAIFTWIAWNINYDYDNRFKNTEITAFYDKCTMCDGFSILMQKMCEAVGLTCDKYTGQVAGLFTKDKIRDQTHAWNLIHLDKANNLFFLVDVTWSSNARESIQKEDSDEDGWDAWFDPDPCYFATSHFSDELGSQVYPDIPRSVFLEIPILGPGLEKYGFDGKELLEFCYKHSISNIFTLPQHIEGEPYPNVLKLPVCNMIRKGKTYDISIEHKGKVESKAFTVEKDETKERQSVACNGFYTTYKLVDKDYTFEEKEVTYKKPDFIYYDDTVSVRNDTDFTITINGDTWYVTNRFDESGFIFFRASSSNQGYPSAIYDAIYQQWMVTAGSYYADSYYNYKNYNIKEFPSSEDDLKAIVNQIFTKPVNESIPLQRRGYFMDADYNEVYIPISNKTEAENAILNYDYTKDTEFKAFVDWMEAHNVPENEINFYKEMARYPSQRGSKGNLSDWPNNTVRMRYAGDDYIAHSRLKDDDGSPYWAGGMQLYFEYRKRETRHLFRNPTIPILCVHIKDTNGTGEKAPANFFEEEQERIKSYFKTAGFTNAIETYFVEIEMDYVKFKKDYIPYDLVTGDNYDWQWSWKKFDLAWEDILALASEKNPELATIFADKNKSAMIRYFDNELNYMWGNINGYALVHSRFDNMMENIGYSTNWHSDLFGTARKTKMPECFDSDCQRETAVCPLCLYSFDID